MGKVIWQPKALENIHAIYDYYYEYMSPQVASDLLNDLLSAPDVLETYPEVGVVEPALIGLEQEFRYLVVRKYWKIIYFVLNNICYIAFIWDTRSNPDSFPTMVD